MKALVIVAVLAAFFCAATSQTTSQETGSLSPVCYAALMNVTSTILKCQMLTDTFDANLTDTQIEGIINKVCVAGQNLENCTLVDLQDELQKLYAVCEGDTIFQYLMDSEVAFLMLTESIFCQKENNEFCIKDWYHLYNELTTTDYEPHATVLEDVCSECLWTMWNNVLALQTSEIFSMTTSMMGECLKDGNDFCFNYFFKAIGYYGDYNFSAFWPMTCSSPCFNKGLTFWGMIDNDLAEVSFAHCHRNTSDPANVPCYVTALQAMAATNVINECYPTQSPNCLNSVNEYAALAGCCAAVVIDLIPDATTKAVFKSLLPDACPVDTTNQYTFDLIIQNLDSSKINWATFKPALLFDLMLMSGLRNDSIIMTDPSTRKRMETSVHVTFQADSAAHLTMIKTAWLANLNAGHISLPASNMDYTVREFFYTPLTVQIPVPPAASSPGTTPQDSGMPSAAAHIAVGVSAVVAALVALF